jgi:transposase
MGEVLDIQTIVSVLVNEISLLKQEVARLTKENAELRARLSRYEHPKDSHNSHLPSSKNPIGMKKTINLREKSERKSGGQPCHPGHHLEEQIPDKIEFVTPNYCTSCGSDLSDIPGEEVERRQQIDIPPILPIVTEYRKIRKICRCSHSNVIEFPAHVPAAICYGPNLQALVTYMSTCQHIPYQRLTGMLQEIFHVSLSQGSIKNILSRMENRLTPAYELIRKQLLQSPVVGVDETGTCVNGKTRWSWVWQNERLTYITSGHSRKKEVFSSIMPEGMPDTVLVSDCYSPYFSVNVKNHQLCTAHILRELTYLSQLYDKHPWSEQMASLIRQAIHLKKTACGEINHSAILQQFHDLLNQTVDQAYKKIQTLQKRLIKYKDYLFLFLKNEWLPPDNNASEREIRVFKVKLKVSGFFKSNAGAQRFALLHSIADTARKNNNSPFYVFQLAANG